MNNRIFYTDHDHLRLKLTAEIVPENEPVYVLRACDKSALATIRVNQSQFAPTSEHWKMCQQVIDDFAKFRKENLKKMKEASECY